jgi:hypothetical protein
MAKTKHASRKHKKALRRQLRNAATMRAPRAMTSPRTVSTTTSAAAPEKRTTWGTETLKTAGGAAGAALACAYIARENWIPPVFVTGLVTAVGTTLAVLGRNDTLRNVGAGVMSAAGAQLGLMLIDNHYSTVETEKRIVQAQVDKAAAKVQADKAHADATKSTRSAENLPPGALEAAYERARARLAMAHAAEQMAPA